MHEEHWCLESVRVHFREDKYDEFCMVLNLPEDAKEAAFLEIADRMGDLLENDEWSYSNEEAFYQAFHEYCEENRLFGYEVNGVPVVLNSYGVGHLQRIVLTCHDSNLHVPPYAEAHKTMLMSQESAWKKAVALAEEECRGLMDGFEGEGSFQVDEGGYPADVAVRWYSVKPEEMEENSFDIEAVTEYNIHPFEVHVDGSEAYFRYRGFDIYQNRKHNRFAVEQYDVRMTMKHSLNAALDWIDDLCLQVALARNPELSRMFSGERDSFEIVLKEATQRSCDASLCDAGPRVQGPGARDCMDK